jgi:predicted nucleotidyltransferase
MVTFRAQDMQKRASQLQEAAMLEPVIITYHDRPRLVVMSMREYDRLRGRLKPAGTARTLGGAVASQIESLAPNGGAKMRPSVALKANKEKVEEILRRFDVSNPRVFGSVARGDDDETSDLDLMVDPGTDITFYDLSRLQSELEAVLGCRVDVNTPEGMSPDVTRNASLHLRPLT